MVFIKKKKCSTVGLHGINIFECSTAAKPKKKPHHSFSLFGVRRSHRIEWMDRCDSRFVYKAGFPNAFDIPVDQCQPIGR